MRIICFANNKGGVGKTTSALSVAHWLAKLGHRTLLIDADPQANATLSLGENPVTGNLVEALGGKPLETVIRVAQDNLFYVAAGVDLSQAEKIFGNVDGYQFFFRDHLTSMVENGGEYADVAYVVIDTAPNLGPLTISALVACECVFIPMLPNFFASEGLNILKDRVDKLRANRNFHTQVRIGGIFFTRYAPSYRKALHHGYVESLSSDPALAPLIMEQTIRENVALDESQSGQESIYDWAPNSNGAADYRGLTDEILVRLG